MKKMMVVKMDINDEKYKLKAMKSVSGFAGVDSISWDMKEAQKKLTIIGDIDPVDIVIKLRKHSHAELLLVAPAEEPEKKKEEPEKKKEEPKKEEPEKKKEEPKKEEPKKEEPKRHYEDCPYANEIPNAYWRNKGYHW